MNPINVDSRILETAKKRNYSTKLIPTLNIPQAEIDKRIKYYYSIPQPPQKSQEWLDQRTNYITASSFGHAIAPKWSSHRNELMKNKVSKGEYNTFTGNEATRWGEKYEDVCCAIYCYRNDVEVMEFGMIPHQKYPFLGASTDGITSKLINLEIKSPFSRKIKPGTVKPLYWQQMQLQMDVLDLNLSHFLECTFHEYPSERDFWLDFDHDDLAHPEKGIIVEVVNREIMNNSNEPKTMYIYSPISLCTNANGLRVWHKMTISKVISSSDQVYIRSHFWILAVYSCVNVARDKEWFNSQVDKFVEFWKEVDEYRNSGGLEQLQEDIIKYKPKPKRVRVESSPKIKLRGDRSLTFDDDGIDDDLPPGYIMSSSDEEIERGTPHVEFEDGEGCLLDSSDDDDTPVPKSKERIQLDMAIEQSLDYAKRVEERLEETSVKKKSILNIRRKSSSSSSSTTTSNYSDSDDSDSEDSIERPDPYRPKTFYPSSAKKSNSFYDDSDSDEDTLAVRPRVEQPKYFRRYKSKRDANKKRISSREDKIY